MKNYRFRIFSFLCLILSALSITAQERLTSPNGNYQFEFHRVDGRLNYSITFQKEKVVSDGELGVDIDNHLTESAMGIPTDTSAVWTTHLRLTGIDRQERDTVWHPLYGEQGTIRDHYNEMTLHFSKGGEEQNADGSYDKRKHYLMDIEVRAYDEGIAFRYHFPEATNGLFMHVTGERTTFPVDPNATAWHEAWAQGPYTRQTLNDWPDESERPLLLSLPSGRWLALLECGLRDYPRGKFRLAGPGVIQTSLFGSADLITPYSTPWRVVMAGEKAVDLINHNYIVLNLNTPNELEDVSFIRPGKAFRSSRLDKENIMKSIDFCAEFGMEYVELDAGWYGPEMKVESDASRVAENRDFNMEEICRYAREKGVGVWLYVNQRALWRQLDTILPVYRRWGVSGVKFGFVQIGSQQWTTWLHDAVKKCGEYGLMVDIHDEYRPTGVSRSLPNLLTQEGIRGNEEMPDATHNVTLPFTRFLCGPGDYTLCYFNNRVKCTHGHQLAMAAVYYSPLQFMFWYDLPGAYQGEEELQFWREIPTVFDESIALDGEPGEYIVQARRSGSTWYVGAMTNTEGRKVSISTSFLPKGRYQVTLYNDDPTLESRTKVGVKQFTIKSGETIDVVLQASGGAAMRLDVRL